MWLLETIFVIIMVESTIKPSFNNNFKGVGLPFIEDITKLKGNIYEAVLNFYDSIDITFEYYGYYFEGLFHGPVILEYLAQLLITKESKAILIMVYLMVWPTWLHTKIFSFLI